MTSTDADQNGLGDFNGEARLKDRAMPRGRNWRPKVLLNLLRMHNPDNGTFGGVAVYCAETASLLCACSDVDVHIVTDVLGCQFLKTKVSCDRITVIADGHESLIDMNLRACWYAAQHNFDLVHRMIGALWPIPIAGKEIATIHDLNFTIIKWGLVRDAYKRFTYVWTALRSPHYVSVSKYTAYKFSLFTKGVLNLSPFVIHNGISVPSAVSVDGVRRKASRRRLCILVFGHHRHKRVDKALTLAGELFMRGWEIEVKVVGKNARDHNGVEEAVAKYGISGCVEFMGVVTDAQRDELYAWANCMFFLSDYEGFGLPVVEAVACGLVVVASKLAVFEELALGNVYLTSSLNVHTVATVEDWLNARLKSDCGPAMRDARRRFSWHNSVASLVSYYLMLTKRDVI